VHVPGEAAGTVPVAFPPAVTADDWGAGGLVEADDEQPVSAIGMAASAATSHGRDILEDDDIW
jgi:hypothetical protein